MELEGICGVTMCYFGVEVGGEVNDGDGFEWASVRVSYHETEPGEGEETYFFTQIPHPIHRNSEMYAILSVGLTSIHSLPREYAQTRSSHGGRDRTHFHNGTRL